MRSNGSYTMNSSIFTTSNSITTINSCTISCNNITTSNICIIISGVNNNTKVSGEIFIKIMASLGLKGKV